MSAQEENPTYIYRTFSWLSLNQFNSWWQTSYNNSLFFAPVNKLFSAIRQFFESKTGTKPGDILQNLSLVVSLLLMLTLGLPQFANDKIGLALISTSALVLWIAGYLIGGSQKRKLDVVDFIVILYLCTNVIATFASHYFMPSVKGLSKVVVYIGSYFLFSTLAQKNRKSSIYLLSSVVITGVALSLHGLYQYKTGVAPLATWEDPDVLTKSTRIYSTLGNPNLLAGFLIPIAPLALGLASSALAQKKWVPSLILYIGTALISLACILTGSRGGYLGLAATIATFALPAFCLLWQKKKKARPYMVVFAVLAIVGTAFALTQIPAFKTRVASIFAGREHSSNSYRLNVWESSFEMFKDNWWFGSGVGNETFRLAYGLYMVSGYDALGTYCVPLEILVECGVFGFLVFLTLIVCLMARAHIGFWSDESGHNRWIYLGLAAAIIGLMTHGVVDTVFYRPQVHFIFWLIVGILAMFPKKSDSLNS